MMQKETLKKIVPPVEPLYDTWAWNQDGSCWGVTPSFDFSTVSTLEVNGWYAITMTKGLNALSSLVRAWKITFGTSSTSSDAPAPVNLEWQQSDSYQQYIEKALAAIREYPVPIYELSIDIDLFVYVRTLESQSQPTQVWVRLPHNELVISSGLHAGTPYLYLDISYTLFGPANKEYGPITGPYPEPEEDFEFSLDDNQLQLLNQPLLEDSLRSLEQSFGAINYVEGIPGTQKYGFLVEPY